MPRFEVVGIGRETGKKRVRIYEVADQESAITAAAADGTVVDVGKIRQLPEIPASESQKQYAKSLGIDFPSDISKIEISRLIDKKSDESYNEEMTDDDALSQVTPSQIIEELDSRCIAAILITFDDAVNFKKLAGVKCSISFSDNFTETEMRMLLVEIGYQYAKDLEKNL
ncbi:MAG: hypothetical protein PHP01_02460 [Phycisphaerae bacterium]|nr:hypothetical protein [Phycisphaerae bacterium]